MNYIRSIVSGTKNRHKENGYDLDLTYITPKVIAMSIPGEGLTKLYRNPLEIVSEFLESKHHSHYLILNLSGIPYAYSKFGDQVKEFPWEDHYPPPIDLLFRACEQIHSWLLFNSANVVAINCRAGKGRTGTLICCYMLFCGKFTDADSALIYYKSKRFKQGGGVTQPSQVRYVRYFSQILNGSVKSPLVLNPVSVQFRTSPHFKHNSCKPIFEMYSDDNLVYSNRQSERSKQVHLNDEWNDNRLHTVAVIEPKLCLQGDILCKIVHWGSFKYSNVCRFSFNTGFIPYNKVLVLRKYELDPYKFSKKSIASDNFAVILEFEQECICSSQLEVAERCSNCQAFLKSEEKLKWEEILRIVAHRPLADPSTVLFGSAEHDDVDEFLGSLDETAEFDLLD